MTPIGKSPHSACSIHETRFHGEIFQLNRRVSMFHNTLLQLVTANTRQSSSLGIWSLQLCQIGIFKHTPEDIKTSRLPDQLQCAFSTYLDVT